MATVGNWRADDLAHLKTALEALGVMAVDHAVFVNTFQFGDEVLTVEWDDPSSEYMVKGIE